jgi:hypothetical protein
MKKIVFILIILLLVTLLFGCFNKAKTEEETYFYNTPVNDGPRRFAIEANQPEIFKEHYELNTGFIEAQGVYFTKWGRIEPKAPINEVPQYTPFPQGDWGSKFLDKVRNSDIEFSTMIEFESNNWAIATDDSLSVISPVGGHQEPGRIGIKPQHEKDYKRFIKDYAKMMPNLKFIQIDDEAENGWVNGEGYTRILELTKESITENNLDIQIMAAGFYIGPELVSIPEHIKLHLKENYPNINHDWIKTELNLPKDTPNKNLDKAAQKLHIVMTLLMREDPPIDILTIHLDGNAPYKYIDETIGWYKKIMKEYNYTRPIWIDDMHSTYYPKVNAESELDIKLNKGLASDNINAINTLKEIGSTHLVRKTVGYFAAGAERVKIAYGSDLLNYHIPTWKYAGLFTSNYEAKPTYYTSKLMIQKLDGFITAEKIGEDYLYKFTFEDKEDVYVAWSEKENGKTINLENEIGDQAKITNIISTIGQTTATHEIKNSNNINLTEEPIFIESN